MKIPLLIFSDAPSAPSGLARITRELATHIAVNLKDVFDVATIGYGGPGSAKLPFPQYSWTHNDEWIIHDLPEVWNDLSGGRKGIMLTIQDATRMLWFARPETCTDNRVKAFLQKNPFEKWGYMPMDATGPNNKLSVIIKECLMGYDRLLCYSQWAENIVLRTLGISEAGARDLQHLPHGINQKTFYPRGRKWRKMFGQLAVRTGVPIGDDEWLIGIVATNQARKDYGVAIEACAELSKRHKVRIWIHTDALDRFWSIPYLLRDFDLDTKAAHLISLDVISDENMACLYSACDVTLAPGLGEGFGYPIFESIACGVPAIHGNYGGAAEQLTDPMLVEPAAYRTEGQWNCVRPVYTAASFADKIESAIEAKLKAELPSHLAWPNLWPKWEAWFRKGVRHEQDRLGSTDAEVGEVEGVLGVVAAS